MFELTKTTSSIFINGAFTSARLVRFVMVKRGRESLRAILQFAKNVIWHETFEAT